MSVRLVWVSTLNRPEPGALHPSLEGQLEAQFAYLPSLAFQCMRILLPILR